MSALPKALAAEVVRVTAARPVSVVRTSGGCISLSWIVALEDGRSVFVKSSETAPAGLYACEAEGLRALRQPGILRTPDVLAHSSPGHRGGGWLILEAIRQGTAGPEFHRRFGERLAALHRATIVPRFGFARDNHIGAAPQSNRWHDDWAQFFRDERIAPQLRMAGTRRAASPELLRLGDAALRACDTRLKGIPREGALIHGDLWGGNHLVDEMGAPVLIDPSCHHAHREAELSMCRLFGGFPADFFAAYDAVWPVDPGWRDRLPLYQLYHLLNHLNLFGGAYEAQCLAVMRGLE